jgi:hypothetical protein
LTAAARGAHAAEDDRACSVAYARAQENERAAHLLTAREQLQTCAKPRCGKVLYEACTALFTQVEADIPSIVPVATDATGAPRVDVKVTMDGAPLTAEIDGRAIPVDPGMHEFAFSSNDAVFATRKVLVVQGQRNRPISATQEAAAQPSGEKGEKKIALAASGDPETGNETAAEQAAEGAKLSADATVVEHQPKHRSLALTYTLATVGVVGLAGFGVMTEWGRKDNALLAQCSPSCPQASVDHVRRMYVAADVSLGVGIAALAASYWAFVSSRSANEDHPTEQAMVFDVRPTRAGAVAGVSGSFK